jgi:predicted tellurium resistance membrane protein TerC
MDPAAVTEPNFWTMWLQIVVLDLVLAGDNALVIALAVRNLPPRQQWLGRMWGTIGAVGLRLVFIGIVTYALKVPLLQAIGGVMLLWIAVKLLNQESAGAAGARREARHHLSAIHHHHRRRGDEPRQRAGRRRCGARQPAGGGAGIGISIPIVIGSSSIISVLLARFPLLIDLGAAILGWVGGRMAPDVRWSALARRRADTMPSRSGALALGGGHRPLDQQPSRAAGAIRRAAWWRRARGKRGFTWWWRATVHAGARAVATAAVLLAGRAGCTPWPCASWVDLADPRTRSSKRSPGTSGRHSGCSPAQPGARAVSGPVGPRFSPRGAGARASWSARATGPCAACLGSASRFWREARSPYWSRERAARSARGSARRPGTLARAATFLASLEPAHGARVR